MLLKWILQDGIFYILIFMGCALFYHALVRKRGKLGTVIILFFVVTACICKCWLFFDIRKEVSILKSYPIDSYATDGTHCYYTEGSIRRTIALTSDNIRYDESVEIPYIEDVRYEEFVGYRYLIPERKIGEKTLPRIVMKKESFRKLQNT